MRAPDRYRQRQVRTAQVDETRAQVFIAQDKYAEAEAVARGAQLPVLGKPDAGAFIRGTYPHGIALARLTKTLRAQSALQEGAEVAHRRGT